MRDRNENPLTPLFVLMAFLCTWLIFALFAGGR